jgi:hypothetical protein
MTGFPSLDVSYCAGLPCVNAANYLTLRSVNYLTRWSVFHINSFLVGVLLLSFKSQNARAARKMAAKALGQIGISKPAAMMLTLNIARHNWATAMMMRKIAATRDAGRFMCTTFCEIRQSDDCVNVNEGGKESQPGQRWLGTMGSLHPSNYNSPTLNPSACWKSALLHLLAGAAG